MNRFLDGLRTFFRTTPVTADLLVVNTIMFLATLAYGGFTNATLLRLGGLVPVLVTEGGEWARVLTAMFLHGGVLHFLMNMTALYYLGSAMERGIGSLRQLGLYLFAGLGADLAIVFLDDPAVLTIGASGALYGIMAALFYITLVRRNWFAPNSVRAIRRMIAINFAFTFLIPGVSIIGHVAGFIAGFAAAVLLVPKTPAFARRRHREETPDDDEDGYPPS